MTPSTPGSWSVVGSTLSFTPATPFVPLKRGPSPSLAARTASSLPRERASPTRRARPSASPTGRPTACNSCCRSLRYSPLSWEPSGSARIAPGDTSAQAGGDVPGAEGERSPGPERVAGPARLAVAAGLYNVFTRGLVMEFEADHGLIVDGAEAPGSGTTSCRPSPRDTPTAAAYDYALADQHAPQSSPSGTTAAVVLRAPANTGIAVSPTPDGNFNVYAATATR